MSAPAFDPITGCCGKRAFTTYAEGMRTLRGQHSDDGFAPMPGHRLNLYRCRCCPAWHIGIVQWPPVPRKRRVFTRRRVGGAK